jgi:hypothetical protein
MKFSEHKTESRGVGRELYKTPIELIEKIVDSLLTERPSLRGYIWCDPCAYDGRWEEVIHSKGVQCFSADIEPASPSVLKNDFLKNELKCQAVCGAMVLPVSKIFFIGNPPFSLVGKFIERAFEYTDKCYFLGGSARLTGSISNKVSLLHRFEGYTGNQKDLRSKVVFEDTNGEDVSVWCCGALLDKNVNNKRFEIIKDRHNGFAVGAISSAIPDERVKVISK